MTFSDINPWIERNKDQSAQPSLVALNPIVESNEIANPSVNQEDAFTKNTRVQSMLTGVRPTGQVLIELPLVQLAVPAKNKDMPLRIEGMDMMKLVFSEDSEDYRKALFEYETLLEKDPLYHDILTAHENGWQTLISRVIAGEINPNQVAGDEVFRFQDDLEAKVKEKVLDDLGYKHSELRQLPEQQAPRKSVEATFFDLALTSPTITNSDLEILLNYGAKINDNHLIALILAPNEEAIKLERLTLLVDYGANINGTQDQNGMTLFEASMVRGDTTIADYLMAMGVNISNADAANISERFNQKSYKESTREYLQKLGLRAGQLPP